MPPNDTANTANIIKNSPFLSELCSILEKNECTKYKNTIASLQNSPLPPVDLKDRLSNELLLDYDRCRGYFDELNVQHMACSSIRAANLSGQCKWSRELLTGEGGRFGAFLLHQQQCVKRKTFAALRQHFPAQATDGQIGDAIEAVFERCYNDYEPFWHPVTD